MGFTHYQSRYSDYMNSVTYQHNNIHTSIYISICQPVYAVKKLGFFHSCLTCKPVQRSIHFHNCWLHVLKIHFLVRHELPALGTSAITWF